MCVTSTQSKQKPTRQRLHISTCAIHRFNPFTSSSCFDGNSGHFSSDAPSKFNSLTAETPRRGGDL